jgi:hypothetical protein
MIQNGRPDGDALHLFFDVCKLAQVKNSPWCATSADLVLCHRPAVSLDHQAQQAALQALSAQLAVQQFAFNEYQSRLTANASASGVIEKDNSQHSLEVSDAHALDCIAGVQKQAGLLHLQSIAGEFHNNHHGQGGGHTIHHGDSAQRCGSYASCGRGNAGILRCRAHCSP